MSITTDNSHPVEASGPALGQGQGLGAYTVYPSIAGAFPAASFPVLVDSLNYVRAMALQGLCGVCSCPASSDQIHYPDTVRPSP